MKDIKYITNIFRKFLNKEKVAKKESKRRNKLICYECGEPGHVKPDCPYLKKHGKRRKRRILEDDDTSSSEDDNNEV